MAAFYAIDLHVVASSLAGVLRGRLVRTGFAFSAAQDRSVGLRGGRRLMWTSWLPSRVTLVTELPPLSLDADGIRLLPPGVLAPDPRTGPVVHLAYEDVGTPGLQGRTVVLAGHPVRFASAEAARLTAARVVELAALSPKRRRRRVASQHAAAFDEAEVQRRVRRFLRVTAPLRVAALLLLTFVFAVLPAVATGLLAMTWMRLGATYLVLLAGVQGTFWFAHRHLHPRARRRRWIAVAAMLVSPADALASPQRLGVDLLAGLHPLAAVHALASETQWTDLAGRLLRGQRHPAAMAQALGPLAAAVEAHVARHGVAPEDLLGAPPALEQSRSWCPRCLQQFATGPGECTDCAGVMRLPYASRRSPPGAGGEAG